MGSTQNTLIAMEEKVSFVLMRGCETGVLNCVLPTVPPSPPSFTPVKLEHSEQQELGYMPFRDDFERVNCSGTDGPLAVLVCLICLIVGV